MQTTTEKHNWALLSGEGEKGKPEIVYNLTRIGIKRRLTKERCGGDRWAWAIKMNIGETLTAAIAYGLLRPPHREF